MFPVNRRLFGSESPEVLKCFTVRRKNLVTSRRFLVAGLFVHYCWQEG